MEEVTVYHPGRLSTHAVFVVAAILGLLIAAADVAAPFGDDTAPFIVFLWLLTSGVLGFARPRRPWWWAVSVGPWLPLTHLIRHALGWSGPIRPDTYGSALILLVFSVAVCSLGAYGGALARRFVPFAPPSA
jgi:hypothetical protein